MLNSDQLQAVQTTSGPVMIVAGPGTGKTKTLVAKIEYLIKKSIAQPEQILALTFTNKAASEIRERLANENIQRSKKLPFIGTFHSFCHHLLSTYAQQTLKLISETERKKLINQLLKNEFGQTDLAGFSLHEISLQLSQLKLSVGQQSQALTSLFKQQLVQLLDAYNFQLATRQLIDFDDLLIKTHELLALDQQMARAAGGQYRFILIDEFQDTHPVQYQIIKLITARQNSPNLTVIGDPLQSIYSFRGAQSDIFDQFQQDFPDTLAITLTINYRSRPQIIALSHSLFPQSQLLTASHQEPAQVNFVTTLNEQSESQWIISTINQHLGGTDLNQASDFQHADQQLSFTDFAIIFRTHHLAHGLETALEKSGIPYQIVGGLSLFEKREIAFLMTVFEHLFFFNDATLEKLRSFSFATPNLIKAIAALKNQIDQLSSAQLIDQLLKMAKLTEAIDKSARKQQDLQAFHQYLAQFTLKNWLAQSVAYFQQLQAHDYFDDRADRVTLLTMHAAKGLEFSHVFLIGFEQGLIPHQKRFTEPEIAEEKRLLYVALTRAKHSLTVLNCQERFRQTNRNRSPFFSELDPQTLTAHIDPQISKVWHYRKQAQDKKRQMSLF